MNAGAFSWKKKALLLLLVGLGMLCVAASLWQVQRAGEVTALLTSIKENSTRKPIDLHSFMQHYRTKATQSAATSLHMMPVRIVGQVVSVPILLDNKMHTTARGRERGYDVLGLVKTEQGYLLVDFGWIATTSNQRTLTLPPSTGTISSIKQIQGAVTADVTDVVNVDMDMDMVAYFDALAKEQFVLQEDAMQSTEATILLQTINFSLLDRIFQTKIVPVVFRADADVIAPPLQPRAKPLTISPIKNYGYVAQWLCFALIAFIGTYILYRRH